MAILDVDIEYAVSTGKNNTAKVLWRVVHCCLCLGLCLGSLALSRNVVAETSLLVYFDIQSRYILETTQALRKLADTDLKITYAESSQEYLQAQKKNGDWDVVLTTSANGCVDALSRQSKPSQRIYCLFVQSAEFRAISESAPNRRLTGIAIDQPLNRQVHIANRLYPQISKIGVLSAVDHENATRVDRVSEFRALEKSTPVVRQVRALLQRNDAILAVPDNQIYTRDNIRSILLMAYSLGKPLIGYSPGYVRAGALLTAYSSPSQIIKQWIELFSREAEFSDTNTNRLFYPSYFSIIVNTSVAESLALSGSPAIIDGRTYSDEDFR